jgi:hypothetical protein
MAFYTLKTMLEKHFTETLEFSDEKTTQKITTALEILEDLDDDLTNVRPSDLEFIIYNIHDEKLKEQVSSMDWGIN